MFRWSLYSVDNVKYYSCDLATVELCARIFGMNEDTKDVMMNIILPFLWVLDNSGK